jgi:ribosomal protein S18 acetylase RimI-like enzyme
MQPSAVLLDDVASSYIQQERIIDSTGFSAMPITIRAAQPRDHAVIVDYNARLGDESEGKTLDRRLLGPGVAAAIDDPHKGRYFLACDGDHVIGQTMITYEWSDWRNGWFWWIQSVYVHPEYRGHGIFRQLYRHIESLARAEGNVIGLRLYVEEENHRAQATYQKLEMTKTTYFVMERYPM